MAGMGALNLADPKKVQLHSELRTPEAKAAITTTASKTRSSGAPSRVISTSSGGASGNVFFTKAVRFNMQPRPMSGRDMSLAANYRRAAGQRFNAMSREFWANPTLRTAQQANISYQQSTASSIGEALGAIGGLMIAGANAYKTLNDAGVFTKSANKSQQTQHQSNSQKLQSQVEQLGNYSPANVPAPSQEVQGYINGMSSCNDAASLKTAITVANGEAAALDSATSIYQGAVDQAEADKAKLESQYQGCVAQSNTAQSQVGAAQDGVKAAELGVKTATDQLKTIDADYGQAVEGYNTAHSNYTDAQNNTKRATANEQDTSTKYDQAKSNTASAKASCQSAEQAWQSCPEKIKGPNGTEIPNPQKAQLKAKFEVEKQKLKQAEQQESNAKIAHDQAKTKLDEAKQKESTAKTEEGKALENKNRAYKKLGDQKEKVDAQEAKVKQQQQLLDKQKANLENCQEAMDTAHNNLATIGEKLEGCNSFNQMLEQHNSSLTQLKDSIASQEQRLGTLEKGGGKDNNSSNVSGKTTQTADPKTSKNPQIAAQLADIDQQIADLEKEKEEISTNPRHARPAKDIDADIQGLRIAKERLERQQ